MRQENENLDDYARELKYSRGTARNFSHQRHSTERMAERRGNMKDQIHQHDNYPQFQLDRDEFNPLNSYMTIESGFRKFKNSQILVLEELRQQYEILRSLPLEGKPMSESKHDSVSSSADRSSVTSKSKTHKERQPKDNQRMLLQRKHLEIMLSNSMKKVEELLHQELDYKKQIQTLKMQLTDQTVDEKYSVIIAQLKNHESQYQQTIEALRRDLLRQKTANQHLNEKVIKLNHEISVKENEVKQFYEQRTKLDQALRKEKDRYFQMQIENKRLKMEYDLLEKNKDSEIQRLMRDQGLQSNEKLRGESTKNKLLQKQIELQDHRYAMLINQLKMFHAQGSVRQGQSNEEIKHLFAKFLSSQNLDEHSDIMSELRDKISELNLENKRLRSEVQRLHFKFATSSQSSNNQTFLKVINQLVDKLTQKPGDISQDSVLKRDLEFLRSEAQNIQGSLQQHSRWVEQESMIRDQEEAIGKLEGNIEKLEGKIGQLQDTISALERENIQLRQSSTSDQGGNNKNIHQQNKQLMSKNRDLEDLCHQLERYIEKQQLEKLNFLEQLKTFRQQHSHAFNANETIKEKLDSSHKRTLGQNKQIDRLKKQLSALTETQGDLSASKKQNFDLKLRFSEIEQLRSHVERLKKQNDQLSLQLKTRKKQNQEEIKNLKKMFDERDFEAIRAKKQGQLNVQLLHRQHLSETSHHKMIADRMRQEKHRLQEQMGEKDRQYQNNLRRLKQENERLQEGYQRRLFQKNEEIQVIRQRFEEKIRNRNAEMDNRREPNEQRFRVKQAEWQQQRTHYVTVAENSKTRYEQEVMQLMNRVDSLNQANQRFMRKNEKYVLLEKEISQLRQQLKSRKTFNEAVDHLWQIKEAQYANVNEIIRQLRY